MGGLGGGAFRKSILLSLINKSSRSHIDDVLLWKRIDVDENLVEPGVFAPHVIFKQSSVTEREVKNVTFFCASIFI